MSLSHTALRTRTAALPRPAISSVAAPLALAGVVLVSAVVRTAATITHSFPQYFPDEYIYSSLGRSLASGHGLEIRGEPAHFPALLEPLLSAPLWALGDVATGYRLVLVWHALAMSLAAVPVFLLCRRLTMSISAALGAAAFSLALPSFLWASFLTADAIGYTLALAAIATFVAALDTPTRRLQAAAALLGYLAVLARVQYVVLPLVFVLAAVVLEHGRLKRVIRRYPLALALLAAPVLVAVAAGPGRVLGYYDRVFNLEVRPGAILHWIFVDAMLLALATGVVLVPAAVTGALGAVLRPRSRAEAALGVVAILFAAALLLEAGLYASNGSARFQERYLMALPPLVAPLFAVGLRRMGRRTFWSAAAVAAALFIFAVRVPLSGYALGSGKQDSPFLQAVYQIELWTGTSTGSLLVAVGISILAVLATAVAAKPRRLLVPALVLGCLVVGGLSYSATSLADRTGDRARFTYAPGNPSWIDATGVGSADLLVLAQTPPAVPPMHLFWNRSLKNVLLLPGAARPDAFRMSRVRIAADGTLIEKRRPQRRALLVEEYLGKASLQDAHVVRRSLTATLWRPNASTRFSWLERNRYYDGWLATSSSITVWPDRSGSTHGTLKLRLYLPQGIRAGSVALSAPGIDRIVQIPSGGSKSIELPVRRPTAWTLRVSSTTLRLLSDGRAVSVKSAPPVFERAPLKPAPARADRG